MDNQIKQTVREIIMKELGIKEISDETDLYSIGMESIKYINIMVEIEAAFKIRIDDETVIESNLRSVNQFSKFIEKLLN